MNSSAKQILIGWIYRRIGFLKRGMKKQIKPLAAILRFLDFSPPIPSFRAQREIFLALCSFLLLSQKVSRFPLSHIGRYTPYRHFERSEKSSLHSVVSCSFRRKVSPFSAITHTAIYPIPSFRAQREIFLALRAFLLLSQKVSPFPLSHIRHYPLLPERSLGFARDDVA